MEPHELLRQQQELAPKDDLSSYDGEWVALRNGHVVAHEADPYELRSRTDVFASDALIRVSCVPSGLVV